MLGYVLSAAAAYLLGSSNMAYWVSKMKKVDIRAKGSGNLGASNATVLLGWGAGVLVAVHDIGKGFLAVMLAALVFPDLQHAGTVAGTACILGHIYPFYLGFRGGKGLASMLGVALALDWRLGLAVVALLVVITLATDFIALGTLAVSVATPVGMWLITGSVVPALILGLCTVIMVEKHLENLRRIRNHTEIGLLSTVKGENRIK